MLYNNSNREPPSNPKPKKRKTRSKRGESAPSRTKPQASIDQNHHNIDRAAGYEKGDRKTSRTSSSSICTSTECPCCQKIYTRRSLNFHLKVCTQRRAEEEKRLSALESAMERQKRGPSRPPGTICYICGRRYTASSWEWHEPKCQEQWNIWNNRLPRQLRHLNGILKPDTSDEALEGVIKQARAEGNSNFTKRDALDKILIKTSETNALPV